MNWLIWSIEHGKWWAPNQNGYTKDRAHAGRYTYDEALEIVTSANERNQTTPDEAMCPEW